MSKLSSEDDFSWLDFIDEYEERDVASEYERWVEEANNNMTRRIKMKKCTCGADAVGGGKHSDWCDMYEEEKDEG